MDPRNNYLLHIESATDVCSVAVSLNATLIAIKESEKERNHASVMTLFIEEVLTEAGISSRDLSALVLSEGPGSYTSLRVGMSVAKGICYGLDIPLIAINTLEAMAQAAMESQDEDTLVCSMIDARRMEVYASLFESDMVPVFQDRPMILEENSFDSYLAMGKKLLLCGDGSYKARELYAGKGIAFSTLKHSAVHLIDRGHSLYDQGEFVDLAYFSPNYVKAPNITKSKKKLL